MIRYEARVQEQGFSFAIGIDEAGRGPLAGPVVAAAVRLRSRKFRHRIRDSKQLTQAQRMRAFFEIRKKAFVGIGVMSEGVIDSINILNATRRAMEQAVANLFYVSKERVQENEIILLIDGNFGIDTPYASQSIIGGDEKCLSIACASIVAKVTRDRIMTHYQAVFPRYNFGEHKGYGTSGHLEEIQKYGPCLIHRRSFHPVKTDDGFEFAIPCDDASHD